MGGFRNRLRWPRRLSRHVSNSSRDRGLGPRFKSPLVITVWMESRDYSNQLPARGKRKMRKDGNSTQFDSKLSVWFNAVSYKGLE